MIIMWYRWKGICEEGYGVGCYKWMYHIVPEVRFSIYITLGLPRCREIGFIQRLYIISTVVRLGLPDGSLVCHGVVRLIPSNGYILFSTVMRSGLPNGLGWVHGTVHC